MTPERVVIIGGGQGGFQAATSLREYGFDGSVTIIGDEPGLPYQRPPLSKAFLKDGKEEKLLLRPGSFYDSKSICYQENTHALKIDREAKTVSTRNDRSIPYDHLILAMGSRNRLPPIPGLELDGVLAIRTLDDARRLRQRMPDIRKAIVIGGGFIGLEFAAVARAAGIAVTVVEAAPRLMARAISPAMSEVFLQAHMAWGTEIILDSFASEVIGTETGAATGLRLSDGREIEGDTIIVAAGVMPNSELAEDAGLETGDGVIVNSHLLTSDPSISALGDCCRFPEPVLKAPTRLESVQAATDHARCIAARLTGKPNAYSAVPWFWSDQGDMKLQIAGLSSDVTEWKSVRHEDKRAIVLGFGGDILRCVETVNEVGPHMAARKLLALEVPIAKGELAQDGYDLKLTAKRLSSAIA